MNDLDVEGRWTNGGAGKSNEVDVCVCVNRF